jgi:hypothetical protein
MKVQLLLIAEVEVENRIAPLEEAQEKLDAFREAVLPSENYGIHLARTSGDELESTDLLRDGWTTNLGDYAKDYHAGQ